MAVLVLTMAKGDNPTLKQRKWLQEYIKTGNATEAAARVYNVKNRNAASQIGWENVRKLDFTELLEEMGVTDQKIAKKIDEGLEAYKVDITGDRHADYNARHKYTETVLKLRKRLENKDGGSNTLTVEVRYPHSEGRGTSTSAGSLDGSDTLQGPGMASES